jgi:cytochrome P450
LSDLAIASSLVGMSDLEHLPLVPGGNALGHIGSFKDHRFAFLRTIAETGAMSRARFLHRWVTFASTPQLAHEVLVDKAKSFEKSPGIRIVLSELAGEGLFTSEGDLWKKQRRLMSPLFHTHALSAYAETMANLARGALDRLRDGEAIDLSREMTRITMGVVAATLFGAESFASADELGDALSVALKWVDDNLASPALSVQLALLEAVERIDAPPIAKLAELRRKIADALEEPVLLPGRNDAELHRAIQTIDARIRAMIDERRAHPQARVDLLTKLLLARDVDAGGGGMSDQQVRDEANTLFVAGHETTANALAWAFHLLSRHPEARARVQAEADAFGPEGPTTYAPERLTYTTRVFKEALRLYPPLLVLPRRTLEPVEIGGHRYPERTIVFVNVHGIHRLPSHWPSPDAFDPDRFDADHDARRPKSAFLPFGDGPRVCIGREFALMEGPIVLATWMRRARFELDPMRAIEPDTFATLRPKGGVPATVRKTV